MMTSTQRYLDEEIVSAKRAENDYIVSCVSLVVSGIEMDYIIDGHHALAAAIADGVAPEIVYPEWAQREADASGHAAYLDAHVNDSNLYNVADGRDIF